MLAEMLLVNSAGLGDVLNPTAGTSLDCGLFAGGVFKGACWCASFPKLCGDISTPQQAAQAAAGLSNPGIYQAIQAPGLPAVSGAYEKGNQTTDEYDAEVRQAWNDWAGNNSHVLDQTAANIAAANIEAAGQPDPTKTGIPMWVWLAAAGAAALVIGGLRR